MQASKIGFTTLLPSKAAALFYRRRLTPPCFLTNRPFHHRGHSPRHSPTHTFLSDNCWVEAHESDALTQSQRNSLLTAFSLATRAIAMPPGRKDAAAAAAAAAAIPKTHKRKRKPGEERFYAVRAGRIPGVYTTWDECQAMINGFAGAQFKAFPTREEAALFAAGKNPNPGSTPDRFYAVAVGNKPGIYTEWSEAQTAYMGVKAPKYKKFETKEAAQEWLQTFDQSLSFINLKDEDEDDDEEEEEDDDDDEDEEGEPVAKRFKSELEKSDIGVAFKQGNDGDLIEIYTDGSTLSNGQEGAVAGVGVFFGDHDPRNISERLPGEVQTNQRAELTAILRALQTVPPTQSVRIWSDSKYAINCVTQWFVRWESNGWKTHKGPVQNRDLVEMVLKEIRKRKAQGTETQIRWVKGHDSQHGNVEADELAVRGANDAKISAQAAGKKFQY